MNKANFHWKLSKKAHSLFKSIKVDHFPWETIKSWLFRFQSMGKTIASDWNRLKFDLNRWDINNFFSKRLKTMKEDNFQCKFAKKVRISFQIDKNRSFSLENYKNPMISIRSDWKSRSFSIHIDFKLARNQLNRLRWLPSNGAFTFSLLFCHVFPTQIGTNFSSALCRITSTAELSVTWICLRSPQSLPTPPSGMSIHRPRGQSFQPPQSNKSQRISPPPPFHFSSFHLNLLKVLVIRWRVSNRKRIETRSIPVPLLKTTNRMKMTDRAVPIRIQTAKPDLHHHLLPAVFLRRKGKTMKMIRLTFHSRTLYACRRHFRRPLAASWAANLSSNPVRMMNRKAILLLLIAHPIPSRMDRTW